MREIIHTHPQMEKDLNVPDDHCIVDREKLKNFGILKSSLVIRDLQMVDDFGTHAKAVKASIASILADELVENGIFELIEEKVSRLDPAIKYTAEIIIYKKPKF